MVDRTPWLQCTSAALSVPELAVAVPGHSHALWQPQQAGLGSTPGCGKEHPRLLCVRQARRIALVRLERFPLGVIVPARLSSSRTRL